MKAFGSKFSALNRFFSLKPISKLFKKIKNPDEDICFVRLQELKEHEQIRPEYLEKLKEEIKADGILKLSIAVDKNTNVIIDGHHRLHALKKLGAEKIPVTYFDYQTPEIKVLSWKKNETVTKEQIIQAGMTGKRFPPKFSKHMIENNGKLFHISSFEKKVDIPLDELKRH